MNNPPLTLVLGASPNPSRYSNLVTTRLLDHKMPVVAVGLRAGEINGLEIQTGHPVIEGVDTITLYIGPSNQPDWYEYILSLKPRRIIFNPGTENQELLHLVEKAGIETTIACTLTMLSVGNY